MKKFDLYFLRSLSHDKLMKTLIDDKSYIYGKDRFKRTILYEAAWQNRV